MHAGERGKREVAEDGNMLTLPESLKYVSRQTRSESVSTWHDLSCHWLQTPGAEVLEVETFARHQGAVQCWRGLADPDPTL
jgi:hypothetical protein